MVLLQSLCPNKSFIQTKTKVNFNHDKQQKIMFNLCTIVNYSLSRYYELESLYPLFKNKNLKNLPDQRPLHPLQNPTSCLNCRLHFLVTALAISHLTHDHMYQLSSNKSLLLLLDLRNPLGIANSRRVDDSELPVSTRLRRSQVQLLARRLKGLGIFEQESLLKEGDIYRLALDLRFPGVLLSLSLQFCVPITRPRDHLALWLVEHQ